MVRQLAQNIKASERLGVRGNHERRPTQIEAHNNRRVIQISSKRSKKPSHLSIYKIVLLTLSIFAIFIGFYYWNQRIDHETTNPIQDALDHEYESFISKVHQLSLNADKLRKQIENEPEHAEVLSITLQKLKQYQQGLLNNLRNINPERFKKLKAQMPTHLLHD